MPAVTAMHGKPAWHRFHKACGKIEVYFDNYTPQRHGVSVSVFTIGETIYPRIARLVYLCTGQGHDAISASIDGLRKSGGSSLEASLAALGMQIDQLAEIFS